MVTGTCLSGKFCVYIMFFMLHAFLSMLTLVVFISLVIPDET